MSSSSQKSPRGRKSPNKPQKPIQHNQTPDNSSKSPPSNQPQPTPTQNDSTKQPGMFQRVAETAAGVAVGSAIGNLVTNGISSLFSSSSDSKTTAITTPEKSSEEKNACEREKLNFIHCTEKEGDVTKCEELQKEYKECRVKYNLP